MTQHTDSHEPTPEFRARLEWQIETALRRESRLSTPVTGGLRRLPVALLVAAALATGAVAGVASEQAQDARQREQLIESFRSDERLAKLRLEMAQTEFDDMRRRFEVGTVGRDAVDATERQLRSMRVALAQLALNVEETTATSAPPRNDLQAPLVGGRDFVRERLALHLKGAQDEVVAAERALAQAKQRMEVGIASRAAVQQAVVELMHASKQLQMLQMTMDVRERAVAGAIKAEEISTTVRRMELKVQVDLVQREIEVARLRVEEIRRLVEVGVATPLEFKRAEVELLEREVELKRLRQEMERIGAVKR